MSDNNKDDKKAKKIESKKEYHSLSNKMPDSECFYNKMFFHGTNDISFDDTQEAALRLEQYHNDSGFIVKVHKRQSNYILARCISHDRCP